MSPNQDLERLGPTVVGELGRVYLERMGGTPEKAAAQLAWDLMRGDPSQFKVGYSRASALLAAFDVFPGVDRGLVETFLPGGIRPLDVEFCSADGCSENATWVQDAAAGRAERFLCDRHAEQARQAPVVPVVPA